MTLPDFLLIGAQRSGTSILHRVLSAHDEVYLPTSRKEVHFFDTYYYRGVHWYERYFPESSRAVAYSAIGEATPDYLGHPDAPNRIYATVPECRLIAILRNPIDRLYSWYGYCRRNRNMQSSLAEFISADRTALEYGFYYKHLKRYLALYPRSMLFVVIYEEFVEFPNLSLNRLASFLNLRYGFLSETVLLRERINSSSIPRFPAAFAAARRFGGILLRHDVNWPVRVLKQAGVPKWFGARPPPPVDDEARAYLASSYSGDVECLSDLLERDLRVWWRGFGRNDSEEV
jgi:hypothetical protein